MRSPQKNKTTTETEVSYRNDINSNKIKTSGDLGCVFLLFSCLLLITEI